MKFVALVLWILASAIALGAERDLRPPDLATLLAISPTIVVAQITAVSASDLELRVERVLKGRAQSVIRVRKPERFDDMPRIAPYAVGERLVLFIAAQGDEYALTGPSGRGEFPIRSNEIVFPERGFLADVPGLNDRVVLSDFTAAIEAFGDCFSWQRDDGRRAGLRNRCPEAQLAQLEPRSPVHAQLAIAARSAR